MTLDDLQARLIYSMIVAGKAADFANQVIDRLLAGKPQGVLPFAWLRTLTDDQLEAALREARSGNYTKLTRGLRELVDARLDLVRCTPAELQTVHGIGPKTARFWILWTRPGARYAALDVHVLRWLRGKGYDAPTSTPADPKTYDQLERAFIAEADQRGMTPRELDFAIWQAGSQTTNQVKVG